MKLRLAKDFEIPIEAVTQTFAAIGRKGAGKTYLATMIAEQMLDAEAQVIVIDPVGNWWGLRVGSDGKSKGKDIFVIGGEHGDVPLVPEAGARIARLLVEKRISAILDVSAFRQGERKRFAADFAEEFFHLKKSQRSPVHIYIEEAQLFIPQRVGPDEARMVGAWENIIRLGRNYGVGATLVTQRPQSVNKEVLSQVECLCVLQVNGTHERKALEEWVQEAGADRTLVGELPGLARGVGYVWSPSWLRVFQKVHFAKKTTFDASATPEVGKETKAANLSSIDVEALRNDLTEVVKLAEQDDPKALKRRIRELESQVRKPSSAVDPIAIQNMVRQAQTDLERRWQARVNTWRKLFAEIKRIVGSAQIEPEISFDLPAKSPVAEHPVLNQKTVAALKAIHPGPPPGSAGPVWPTNGSLSKAERLILTVLTQYPYGRSKVQIALITAYSHNGGSFQNALGHLRSLGFIEGGNELMRITAAGRQAIGPVDELPTGIDLLRKWQTQSSKAEKEILDVLFEAYPTPLTKQDIAERTPSKYQAEGGSFQNSLGRLRTLELIKGRREMVLSEELVGS